MIGDELAMRTRAFALEVVDLCLGLGTDDLARLVRPQLLRAGTGVATNYRAARQSRTTREFISKLAVVVEEADESEFWLDLLQTRSRGDEKAVQSLRQAAMELRAIFGQSRATAIRRLRQQSKRD